MRVCIPWGLCDSMGLSQLFHDYFIRGAMGGLAAFAGRLLYFLP
jgi:hypothetical protein